MGTEFRAKKIQELREKRSAESEIEKEMRLNKQKEYDHEKRSAESDIEKERRQTQDKEYHSQKRSAESDIEKERRLSKDKSTKHKRYTQATQFRAKKIQELIEKRRQPTKDWKQE